MGYEVRFAPTEEAMKKYKPWKEDKDENESYLEDYKRDLVSYCMKNHEDKMTSAIARELSFKLRLIYSSVEMDEHYRSYYRWKEDEDHELWYCGWEFAHDRNFDKDDIIEQAIDELLIFADLVKTPDYFTENDNFLEKLKRVREYVCDIVDSFETLVIHDMINELDEFKVNDDEFIPEEAEPNEVKMHIDSLVEAVETKCNCTLTINGRNKVKESQDKGLSFDVICSMLEESDKIEKAKEKEDDETKV